jgi:hypothetical protein
MMAIATATRWDAAYTIALYCHGNLDLLQMVADVHAELPLSIIPTLFLFPCHLMCLLLW